MVLEIIGGLIVILLIMILGSIDKLMSKMIPCGDSSAIIISAKLLSEIQSDNLTTTQGQKHNDINNLLKVNSNSRYN